MAAAAILKIDFLLEKELNELEFDGTRYTDVKSPAEKRAAVAIFSDGRRRQLEN
jgi:hypothetical protein